MTSIDQLKARIWKAMTDFKSNQFRSSRAGCTDETSTKNYLINPYLDDVLGISTANFEQVRTEVLAEGYKGGKADFVFRRNGEFWCVVEAKALSRPPRHGERNLAKKHWSQLKHYADSTTFANVAYFVLTDGRFWLWYRRKIGQYLPEEPFLRHDVSAPTKDALNWYAAISKPESSLVDLDVASRQAILAAAAKGWLKNLKAPDDRVLQFVLESEGFGDLGSTVVGSEALRALRTVWVDAYEAVIRAPKPPKPKPPTPPQSDNSWRLGSDLTWKTEQTAAALMLAVLEALGSLHPVGPAQWFDRLAAKKPNWINRDESEEARTRWRNPRSLGFGYSAELNLSNKDKASRLQFFADELRSSTGIVPGLEIHWPPAKKRKGGSSRKNDLSTQSQSRPGGTTPSGRPRGRPDGGDVKANVPAYNSWRLGSDSTWKTEQTAAALMIAVLKALGSLHPVSPARWFDRLAAKKPNWINRDESEEARTRWRKPRSLGYGYSTEVNLNNRGKALRLQFFADEFRRMTGKDSGLEIRWPPAMMRSGGSSRKEDPSTQSLSRPGSSTPSSRPRGRPDGDANASVPAHNSWRLGSDPTWKTEQTAAALMIAVLKALGSLHPVSPARWFDRLAAKKPTWINRDESEEARTRWRKPRSLGYGYSTEVNLNNRGKALRLQFFADELRSSTGIDPGLEFRW